MAEAVSLRYRADCERIGLIASSHARVFRRALVPAGGKVVEALWRAPLVILAHDTRVDPQFFFVNRLALAAFEAGLDTLLGLPSRLSAEPEAREARQALLARVHRDGCIDDYAGMRITLRGRRFAIAGACVWNLVDAAGHLHGQAACFVAPAHAAIDGSPLMRAMGDFA